MIVQRTDAQHCSTNDPVAPTPYLAAVLSDEEVAAAIGLGHEARFVEFKAAGAPDERPFLAHIARACLAMANQRDGGYVLIGVDDADPLSGPNGLTPDQLAAWMNYDVISSRLNAYADPALALDVAVRRHPDGNPIIVIKIGEFEHTPVLCKKDSLEGRLQQGALYTRSRSKPESSAQHSHAEMREVIDLATKKALSAFIQTARGAGLELGTADSERFLERLAPLYTEPELEKLMSRAHLEMTFWPNEYAPERLPFHELDSRLRQGQFRTGGGTYPQAGTDIIRSQHAITWIQPFLSNVAWRFDQSGAFALIDRIGESAADPDAMRESEDPRITGYISLRSIVTDLTRAMIFAGNLMNAVDTNDATCVLSLNNIRGRTLTVNEIGKSGFFENYTYGDNRLEARITLSAKHRSGGTNEKAADVVIDVLHRFGWSSVSRDTVTALQREYLGHSL